MSLCFQGPFSQFHLEQAVPREEKGPYVKVGVFLLTPFLKVDSLHEEEKNKNTQPIKCLSSSSFLTISGRHKKKQTNPKQPIAEAGIRHPEHFPRRLQTAV